MRKAVSLVLLLVAAMSATAQQQMRVWQNGEGERVTITADPVTFTDDGASVNIGGRTYNTSTVDSITMVHILTVNFSDDGASVDVGKVQGVTYTVDGGHVTINNANVRNEVEVVLQGSCANGSFTYVGQYKCKIYLNGVHLTSSKGAAVNILCGKRIDLILNDGTENSLEDAAGGTHKAALYCKGYLEFSGGGSLTVSGNTKHAIDSKEYMELKKSTGTITVAKAVSDALHCGQYFLMKGGTINIDANTGNDGIQSDIITLDDDTTPDPSKEDNTGGITIEGGVINAVVASQDCKGIKADGDIVISGGTIDIKPTGDGSRGIQTKTNMVVGCESAETNITIATSGGKCTLTECKDDPHRCMGIKVDGNLTVNGGTITVTHTKSSARDIKVGGTYKKNGGTVNGAIA